MNIFSPICPYCGRKTIMAAPNRKTLGARFGENVQGISYYCDSRPKILPYTVRHSAAHRDIEKPPYTTDLTHYYTYIRRYRIVIVHDMIKMLNRFNIRERFEPKYAYRCKHCGGKLSFNYNPFAPIFTFPFTLGFGLLLTVLYGSLINVVDDLLGMSVLYLDKFTRLLRLSGFALAGILFVAGLYTTIGYSVISKRFSNIVPTDMNDDYIVPSSDIGIDKKSIKKGYSHRSNIFETELEGETFRLYLTEKGKHDLKLHICGIEGEREALLSLIREKQSRGETVTLPLTFEDKPAGKAEVLEIYDRSEDTAKTNADKTVWTCKGCGYVNPVSAAECKSCGKWKE